MREPIIGSKALKPKSQQILKALQRKRGATLEELCEMTGWQRHSVRGYLSGTLRKKKQLSIVADVSKTGIRRYRIEAGQALRL